MSIREFRRLSRAHRRQIIDSIEDPLTQRILRSAFLGPGKRSWVQVAMMLGGGNDPESIRKRAQRALQDVPFLGENCATMET